jgi:hypothetical protein
MRDKATSAEQLPPEPETDDEKQVMQRLLVSNATIERLAVLVQARPAGILMLCDELSSLFANLSRSHGGSDRGFWLEAWGGNRHVVERMSRESVDVAHLAVGLMGGMQPAKLEDAFGDDGEDGFHARFLYAWPEEAPFQPLSDDITAPDPAFSRALERLAYLPTLPEDFSDPIPLSAVARDEFDVFRRMWHDGKRALEGRELGTWAKLPAHALRLAGTLCYMDWAWNSRADDIEPLFIGPEYVRAAVRLLLDYFWPHGKAAVRQIGLTDTHVNARRVLRWLRAQGPLEGVSVEGLREHALSRRLDSDGTKELLGQLVKRKWLRELPKIETGGRPLHRWAVHPALYRQAE